MKNYTEECLITLAEECAEVIQIISKIHRFGMTSHHPNDVKTTNLDSLHSEVGDVLTMIDLLREEGVLSDNMLQNAKLAKRIKFKKFSIFNPREIVIDENGVQ